jgi:hypothetical protein
MATQPREDMVKNYQYVPEDFMKHLMGTLGIVTVLVLVLSVFVRRAREDPFDHQDLINPEPHRI